MTLLPGDSARAQAMASPISASSTTTSLRAERSNLDLAVPRAQRGAKPPIDPWQPLGTLWEDERQPCGGIAPVLTVFLAGAECPFSCVFCDLWRHTLDGPTPAGALPAQLEKALAAAAPIPAGAQIKLYNASNFFEPRAVPPEDDSAIAALLAPFAQVIVECHPRLVGARAERFAARLAEIEAAAPATSERAHSQAGATRRLQVAMGLETVHPQALPRLGKAMTLDDFAGAATRLRAIGCGVRAFVLVGAPFVPAGEAAEWAVRSAAWAFAQGVEHVSLIPVRGEGGDFAPPSAASVEDAFDGCLALGAGVATIDTWDLDRLLRCDGCREARRARLQRMNLSGNVEPRVPCERCA